MSLTIDQKKQYVAAINSIWGGTMQCNNIDCISENVANLMDSVFNQIKEGSSSMFIMDLASQILIIKLIYGPAFSTWRKVVEMMKDVTEGTFGTWIDIVKGNTVYRSVVNSAAVNYKSPVQIALYDAAFGF